MKIEKTIEKTIHDLKAMYEPLQSQLTSDISMYLENLSDTALEYDGLVSEYDLFTISEPENKIILTVPVHAEIDHEEYKKNLSEILNGYSKKSVAHKETLHGCIWDKYEFSYNISERILQISRLYDDEKDAGLRAVICKKMIQLAHIYLYHAQ